jgi:hypothetical protein
MVEMTNYGFQGFYETVKGYLIYLTVNLFH